MQLSLLTLVQVQNMLATQSNEGARRHREAQIAFIATRRNCENPGVTTTSRVSRVRHLRFVGSSVLGDADKQENRAGQKLKLPRSWLRSYSLFTQHKDTKSSKCPGYLPLYCCYALGSYVDVHRAGASNSRAENIQ